MTTTHVNHDVIRDFLTNTLDRKAFHVYAINPKIDNPGWPRGVATRNIDHVLDFIEKKQAIGHNVYFALNTPSEKQSKKAKKNELRWIEGVHIDLDPPLPLPKDLAAWQEAQIDKLLDCPKIPGKPVVWISGSGVQALWLLKKPRQASPELIEEVELINLSLMAEFGAPTGTQNADRILRLPGTRNFPDKKKLLDGKKVADAIMVYPSQDFFELDDFAALPPPKREHLLAGSSGQRIDYTLKSYSPGYEPLEADYVLRERPDIETQTLEHYHKNGDRSASAFSFISACVTAIMDREGCSAEDLVGDIDTKKNTAHLVWDAAPDIVVEHYEDQKDPRGRVGRDIDKMLHIMATDNRHHTPTGEARRQVKAELAASAKLDPETLDPHEARRQFIQFVQGACVSSELPNDAGGSRQLATESNLRAVLLYARIEARWNVMRDEVSFRVLPDAGGQLKAGRPAAWFERALVGFHAGDRAAAEMSLMLDSFAQHGITQRSELPEMLGLIAREKQFHPMEDYCTARAWDGVRRIEALAKRLETDNPLAGRYLQVFFRQAVGVVASLDRYKQTGEGEMLDSVVVLNGPQRIGKTRFWNALIPPGFKSEGSTLKLGSNKETDSMAEVLSGAIANLDEFETTLLRSEHSAFKNFMSAKLDRYRVAYARRPIVKPRMTTFVGTANDLMLYDQTGSRRFLVIALSRIDHKGLDAIDLQQCYAEAWHDIMIEGLDWWLTDEEEVTRDRFNKAHQATDEGASAVNTYFNHVGDQHQMHWCTATQICKLVEMKYSPATWSRLKTAIDAEGCEYKAKVTVGKREYRKVWLFPVLPERWEIISAG